MKTKLSKSEINFIEHAAKHFFYPSPITKAFNRLGKPLEMAFEQIPDSVKGKITKYTQDALLYALKGAVLTMPTSVLALDFKDASSGSNISKWGHTFLTSATGAAGGFFGVTAIAVELPVTTSIMMRSVATTARNYGEDLTSPVGLIECLHVFAICAVVEGKSVVESYYGARMAMESSIRQAAKWAAGKGIEEIIELIAKKQAPFLIKLIFKIAERFEITVTEKFIMQAGPVFGALSGAAINMAFTEQIGATSTYHFGMRSLEREHGKASVKKAYEMSIARLKQGEIQSKRKRA